MRYSIDTSALLDGWKRYYPPDVFPALWAGLDGLIEAGVLVATEEVLIELEKRDDEVYAWALQRPAMFWPLDEQVQQAVAGVLRQHPRLVGTRRGRSSADAFVIALAIAEGCTVVTGETATANLNRPNIPDVCSAMGLPCINLLQLMRNEGWVFGA